MHTYEPTTSNNLLQPIVATVALIMSLSMPVSEVLGVFFTVKVSDELYWYVHSQ